MLALGTIGLSYAPNAPCHHPPTARRSALLTAAEPSRWQVDAEAAFVAPAAPVPRRVEGGRQAQKTQKASSLEAYMRSLSLDGIASALSNQLGLDAVVDCVGDRPDLRSALRDCEGPCLTPHRPPHAPTARAPPHPRHPPAWSPDFAWTKNDRVLLLQPWLMLRGTWLQPRLAVRLRRHADDIEVEIRCLGVTHWDWQSQLAKEVELAGLQLNAWCTW